MTPAMKEVEQLKQRLKNSVMGELAQEKLINYFSPIYYVKPCRANYSRVYSGSDFTSGAHKKRL